MQQPTKQRTSPLLILLLFIIIVLLSVLVFQNFSNKRVQTQPTIPTATPVQSIATSDPLVSIQTDIDKLKSEVNDIEQGKSTGWLDVLVVSAPTLVWTLAIIFFLLIFLKPLTILVDNLANRMSNSVIEIASGIKIGSNEVGNAIEQREILKIALKLSNADKGAAEEKELYYIGQLAESLNDSKEYLTKDNKLKVLSVATKVALIDGEFSQTEYEEILIQANRYNLSGEDINKLHETMINEMLIRRHYISSSDSQKAIDANDVIPPLQLKNRYELAKEKLNTQLP